MRRSVLRRYPCLGAACEWDGLAWARGVGREREREKKRVWEVAEGYDKTTCEAVRAVNPNHLIFGDRYNGNRGIPRGVPEALKKHVDVLSVQYFCEPNDASRKQMVEDLAGWRKRCGKLVLVADVGNWCATEMNPQRASGLKGQEERGEDCV